GRNNLARAASVLRRATPHSFKGEPAMSFVPSVYECASKACHWPRMMWTLLMIALTGVFLWQARAAASLDVRPQDPGVRAGAPAAGDPIAGLSAAELEYFLIGKDDFVEAESVDDGLGPRMNLDSCAGCHTQPAIGGSSPPVNPQVAFASKDEGRDNVPPFITENGPVREARFVANADGSRDGGVHALFTISGRSG